MNRKCQAVKFELTKSRHSKLWFVFPLKLFIYKQFQKLSWQPFKTAGCKNNVALIYSSKHKPKDLNKKIKIYFRLGGAYMFYFTPFLGIINTRIYKTYITLFFLKKNFSLISKLFLNPARIEKIINSGLNGY